MKSSTLLLLLCAFPVQSQVVDVNGDGTVGPHEAIAVADQWKQEAKQANDHHHLGQTWEGEGNPLKLRGSFSERILPHPTDLKPYAIEPFPRSPSAPLALDNSNPAGYGLKVDSDGSGMSVSAVGPDLILRGDSAVIAATDEDYENLHFLSNNNVYLSLDHNRDDPHTSGFYIFGRSGYSVLELSEDGDMWLRGSLTEAMLKTTLDHPLDPTRKVLAHSAVFSPEMKNVYDGVVVLDEVGQAWVELPHYFEALNTSFRYQLTPIGSSAPDLFIAQKIEKNRFKIAGGTPGGEVSWQVTGIRQDAYAKAHPIEVETEKPEGRKGPFIHPELFGESSSKGFSRISE